MKKRRKKFVFPLFFDSAFLHIKNKQKYSYLFLHQYKVLTKRAKKNFNLILFPPPGQFLSTERPRL